MPTSTTFTCARCGALAASLSLDEKGWYVIDGFLGNIGQATGSDALALQWALEDGSAFHIHAINRLWAPFYCPECDAIYCKDCWRIELEFEDEPGLPGWYDCAYGTCPAGHRRMVDD